MSIKISVFKYQVIGIIIRIVVFAFVFISKVFYSKIYIRSTISSYHGNDYIFGPS